ncbi:hypothetical protein MLD38_040113 [Melastoma candidum]|uniref:Uncharacterized protein n=1 Tax=Melastoma candidum TaxID=119954 RepID=A0ACB9L6I0_9MYRT|nr:hypothetical protein MLD38_040113 [Melastoma candidum]
MDMEDVWRPTQSKLKGYSLSPSRQPSKNLLHRSFSTRSSSYSTSYSLSRSSSLKSSVSPKGSLARSLSRRTSDISKRCGDLAREHKARFYIIKRCVGMLVRWRRDGDS